MIEPSPVKVAKVITGATTNDTLVVGGQPSTAVGAGPVGSDQAAVGSPVLIRGWSFVNKAAYPVYVHVYDKATICVTGTDVPLITIPVPNGMTLPLQDNLDASEHIQLNNGFAWSASKGYADTDAVATAAGDVVGYFLYD